MGERFTVGLWKPWGVKPFDAWMKASREGGAGDRFGSGMAGGGIGRLKLAGAKNTLGNGGGGGISSGGI